MSLIKKEGFNTDTLSDLWIWPGSWFQESKEAWALRVQHSGLIIRSYLVVSQNEPTESFSQHPGRTILPLTVPFVSPSRKRGVWPFAMQLSCGRVSEPVWSYHQQMDLKKKLVQRAAPPTVPLRPMAWHRILLQMNSGRRSNTELGLMRNTVSRVSPVIYA